MKNLLKPLLNFISTSGNSHTLKVGDPAPLFQTTTHKGDSFDLAAQKNSRWTVLFFYPKADTPGCTKQACAFRDSLALIREKNAEVFGISGDTVESIAKFHQKYSLNFTLLADPNADIISSYGVKLPGIKFSKRWTFLIDPSLSIRHIETDVDPSLDAQKVAALLDELQKK